MIYCVLAVWVGGLVWTWAILAAGARADAQMRKIMERPTHPVRRSGTTTTTLYPGKCDMDPSNDWDPHGPDCPPCCERLPQGIHCPKHCTPF